MVVILEKEGTKRCAIEATKIESFTQKSFLELITESHSKGNDYFLGRIRCSPKEDPENLYYCYDARQLCKYIFEMVISGDGRKIRIKNFKDPINKKNIAELSFFRLRCGSDTPLRAEYLGNHLDFLESHTFRSKLFNREDPLDSLSVNFDFNKKKLAPFSKKQLFSFFLSILFIFLITSIIVFTVEKSKINFFEKNERETVKTKVKFDD